MKYLKHRTHDVAFLDRMPAGIPGDVSRKEGAVIEARPFDATNPPAAFGQFVALDGTTKNIRKLLAGDSAATVYGALIRPYPQANVNTTDGLGTSTPNTLFPANVLKRGYFTALLQNSTAAAMGGQVYARAAATSGNLKQGGIEAAAAGSAAAVAGTNTGNGTCGTVTVGAEAVVGAYSVKASLVPVTASGTPDTKKVVFDLFDPSGNLIDSQVAGQSNTNTAVFANGHLGFTLTTGSTPWAAGDSFTITTTLTNIAVPGAIFMGPADSNGNVEVNYKM